MKKETFEIPQFESVPVQTGVRVVEMWVTSDGRKFDTESEAERNEFLWRTDWSQKNPNPHYDPRVYKFANLEEAKRLESMYWYNGNRGYNLEEFSYPCKLVHYTEYVEDENNKIDECGYCSDDNEIQRLVPLEDYKKLMIEHIDSL